MIIYGKNVLSQLASDPEAIETLYAAENLKDKKLLQQLEKSRVPVSRVPRSQLDRMTNGGVHNGIAASVRDLPVYTLDELLEKKHNDKGFYIALDGLQDPHNIGAILRTADCAGADGVIMTRHHSAGLTPTAIKASVGAAYTVPVAQVTNMSQALKKMKEAGYWVAGTDIANARDYTEGMYDQPVVLVIGSEGKGISPLVKKQCDYMVTLPMLGQITSLNASVAAGILMYQVLDARRRGQ